MPSSSKSEVSVGVQCVVRAGFCALHCRQAVPATHGMLVVGRVTTRRFQGTLTQRQQVLLLLLPSAAVVLLPQTLL
jgi:hypothetical protein